MTADSTLRSAVEATSRPLLTYFLRRVHPAEDAADLVAQTFDAAWRSRTPIPADPDEARMWMFGIARNVLSNHRRGVRRAEALVERLRAAIITAVQERPDEHDDVRRAVDALPPDLAEFVRLVHWDGFTVEAAAQLLGIPSSTARGRHQRAKALLREALAVAVE